jgi:hypothetical protein
VNELLAFTFSTASTAISVMGLAAQPAPRIAFAGDFGGCPAMP